jgi:hypothetical protein
VGTKKLGLVAVEKKTGHSYGVDRRNFSFLAERHA